MKHKSQENPDQSKQNDTAGKRDIYILFHNEMSFAVWKDDIIEILEDKKTHHIPLCDNFIAGAVFIDSHTSAVADLAVCLGINSSSDEESKILILNSQKNKLAGFKFNCRIEYSSINMKSVYSLPEYISTPEINSVVQYKNYPVPILNILETYSRVQKGISNPPTPELNIAEIDDDKLPDKFKVFISGENEFSIDAKNITDELESEKELSQLNNLPDFIEGILFHDNNLIPVINVSARIHQKKIEHAKTILITNYSKNKFGLLVNNVKDTIKIEKKNIHSIPPLAQTNWMKNAIFHRKKIIPIINLSPFLSDKIKGIESKEMFKRYKPDSEISAKLGKDNIEIVEFTLFGTKHALLKSHVKDHFKMKPFCELPNTLPIVVGLTEHNGEFLPVLDLAICFKQRSIFNPDWEMIHVVNGDFHALVITEKVLGEKTLSTNKQYELPINLPHSFVYECYPDENSVRLILNVEALAVYFEEYMSKEFIEAYSHEIIPGDKNIEQKDIPIPKPDKSRIPEETVSKTGNEIEENNTLQEDTVKQSEKRKQKKSIQTKEKKHEPSTKTPIDKPKIPEDNLKTLELDNNEPDIKNIDKDKAIKENKLSSPEKENDVPKKTEDIPDRTLDDGEFIYSEPETESPKEDTDVIPQPPNGNTKKYTGLHKWIRPVSGLIILFTILITGILKYPSIIKILKKSNPLKQLNIKKNNNTLNKEKTPIIEKKASLKKIPVRKTIPKKKVYIPKKKYTVLKDADGNKYYITSRGDTLSEIALFITGKSKNYKKIADINDIPDPNNILPNQKLIIP